VFKLGLKWGQTLAFCEVATNRGDAEPRIVIVMLSGDRLIYDVVKEKVNDKVTVPSELLF
jgi:hypothetical protein